MIFKNFNCFHLKIVFLYILILSFFFSCAGMAVTAEEYYSIGMAYFDLGKYEDAEKWLNRARQADRTMVASTYNLGRLAFERKRYDEAAVYFENILRRDPDNILALRAAAYTRIITGEIEIAEKHYSRLLTLVPESADSGYNHALVLYVMGRYSASEEVLEKYPIALQENKDVMLLYARSQAAQDKVEAIENLSVWLSVHSDPKARYEYARILEHYEYYARALEEYRKTLTEITAATLDPKGTDIRFAIARVLLTADSTSNEGITELQNAVSDGFNNITAVEELLNKASGANRENIQNIINNMRRTVEVIEQNETTENELILEDYS